MASNSEEKTVDYVGPTEQDSKPAELHQRVQCELGGVSEVWDIDDLDEAAELRDAIETVRNDHDHEHMMKIGTVWIAIITWNEKTEGVWVEMYGYNSGYRVE